MSKLRNIWEMQIRYYSPIRLVKIKKLEVPVLAALLGE